MAKKQKTIDTTKLNTLLSFTDLVEKDVQKGERRIFGQRHIDQIEKEQARDFVQEKFDAYIQATEAFNRARIEQGVAKLNLQNALDKGFAAQGWVSKEGYWNILGLDDAKNIVYEDTPDRKYEDRFNWLNRRSRRRVDPTVEINQDHWDWTDKDTPEALTAEDFMSKPSLQGTPGGTSQSDPYGRLALPTRLADNPTAYRDVYRKLPGIELKLDFYKTDLDKSERPTFFSVLNVAEKKSLYNSLPDDLKAEVEAPK